MPAIEKGESQKNYVSRCIPIVMKEGGKGGQKHAIAKCYGMYRQHEKTGANYAAETFPEPTKQAFAGLDVRVENPVGSVRSGKDETGKPWSVRMKNAYGFIARHKGEDGEGLDVFLGPDEKATNAYVIHQNNPRTGDYDEDKIMLGFPSNETAKAAYLSNYDSPKFFRSMTEIPMETFKQMLTNGKPGGVHWKKKMGRNHETTAMFSAEEEDGKWVTIHGAHVFIEKGKVTKGPEHLVGKTQKEIEENKVSHAEIKNVVRSITQSEPTKQKRAKHNEVAPNGETYRGGAFIATTEMPKRIKQKLEHAAKGKVRVGMSGYAVPEPGKISIVDKLGGSVMNHRDGSINETYLNYIEASPNDRQMYKELAKKHLDGQEWVSVYDYPKLANLEDAARLYLAGKAIPDDLLKKLPSEYSTRLKNLQNKRDEKEASFSADKPRMTFAQLKEKLKEGIAYAADDDTAHWVTIGAEEGEDGKKHGGTPVQINSSGKIEKGPSKLAGKNVSRLGKKSRIDWIKERAAALKNKTGIQGLQNRVNTLGENLADARKANKENSGNRIAMLKDRMAAIKARKAGKQPGEKPEVAEPIAHGPAPAEAKQPEPQVEEKPEAESPHAEHPLLDKQTGLPLETLEEKQAEQQPQPDEQGAMVPAGGSGVMPEPAPEAPGNGTGGPQMPGTGAMPDFPHQMPVSDYLGAYKQHREANGLPVIASEAVNAHEKSVADALKAGHNVPPEVLKDYAHLQAPHAHQKQALERSDESINGSMNESGLTDKEQKEMEKLQSMKDDRNSPFTPKQQSRLSALEEKANNAWQQQMSGATQRDYQNSLKNSSKQLAKENVARAGKQLGFSPKQVFGDLVKNGADVEDAKQAIKHGYGEEFQPEQSAEENAPQQTGDFLQRRRQRLHELMQQGIPQPRAIAQVTKEMGENPNANPVKPKGVVKPQAKEPDNGNQGTATAPAAQTEPTGSTGNASPAAEEVEKPETAEKENPANAEPAGGIKGDMENQNPNVDAAALQHSINKTDQLRREGKPIDYVDPEAQERGKQRIKEADAEFDRKNPRTPEQEKQVKEALTNVKPYTPESTEENKPAEQSAPQPPSKTPWNQTKEEYLNDWKNSILDEVNRAGKYDKNGQKEITYYVPDNIQEVLAKTGKTPEEFAKDYVEQHKDSILEGHKNEVDRAQRKGKIGKGIKEYQKPTNKQSASQPTAQYTPDQGKALKARIAQLQSEAAAKGERLPFNQALEKAKAEILKEPSKEGTAEADDEKSRREWSENASRVADNPSIATPKDLRRAAGYLSAKMNQIQQDAWSKGTQPNGQVIDGLKSEMDWYSRLADQKEAQAKPPVEKLKEKMAGKKSNSPQQPAAGAENQRTPEKIPLKGIPYVVARAIHVLNAPNHTLNDFIRAYGKERGKEEWEAQYGKTHKELTDNAKETVEKAKGIAKENGWDWGKVEELARQTMGVNENWNNKEQQRFADLEAKQKEDYDKDMAKREGIQKATNEQFLKEKGERELKEKLQKEKVEAESQRKLQEESDRKARVRENLINETVEKLKSNLDPQAYEMLAGNKKLRQRVINDIALGTGIKNEEIINAALERVRPHVMEKGKPATK